MPTINEIFPLPERFAKCSSEQLKTEYPYVWRTSERVALFNTLLGSGAASWEEIRHMQRTCLYPPNVMKHFRTLVETTDRAVMTFLVGNASDRQAAIAFDSDVVDGQNRSEMAAQIRHGYISEANVTIAGMYPMAILAEALGSTRETFYEKTRKFLGEFPLLRVGKYFLEIAPQEKDTVDGVMATGVTRQMTDPGLNLWQHLITYHMDGDPRLNEV